MSAKKSNDTTLYFDLKERNEHEGETWHFYCGYPKVEAKEFEALLDRIEFDGDGTWGIDHYGMEEVEVKVLVKYSESGYMSFHSFGGCYTVEEMKAFVECKKCLESTKSGEHGWYKGSFSFTCRHEKEEEDEEQEENEDA